MSYWVLCVYSVIMSENLFANLSDFVYIKMSDYVYESVRLDIH